jgi:UDPglucose--hexose-1-phosphate uridylyltransferase
MEEALYERLVEVNPGFVAVVPYWAVWPFEVMILPRRHMTQLQEMTDTERLEFAAILQTVAATYDQVFDTPFPYSMGLHPAPCDRNHILSGSFMFTSILPCCVRRRFASLWWDLSY